MKKVFGISSLGFIVIVGGYVTTVWHIGRKIDEFANSLHLEREVDLP